VYQEHEGQGGRNQLAFLRERAVRFPPGALTVIGDDQLQQL
jgi:hypothetical protein